MRLLDHLQRRFGRYAVPHVTEGLIACQVLVFLLSQSKPALLADIALVPARVLQGEVWRLVTFVCQIADDGRHLDLLLLVLVLPDGHGVGEHLGHVPLQRVSAGGLGGHRRRLVHPARRAASIMFLQGSVFLAFAYLYPNFQFLLFFILPVKVKWLALLQWIGYFLTMLSGSLTMQLMATAAVCNFLLFFWHDIFLRARSGQRRMALQAEHIRTAHKPRHTCVVCGVTNLSDPKMGFRYCSKCIGAPCYCTEHINHHEHVVEESGRAV